MAGNGREDQTDETGDQRAGGRSAAGYAPADPIVIIIGLNLRPCASIVMPWPMRTSWVAQRGQHVRFAAKRKVRARR